MTFTPEIAEFRFGFGLSPVVAPPQSAQAMLQGLTGPDDMAQRYAIDSFDVFQRWLVQARDLRNEYYENRASEKLKDAFQERKKEGLETDLRWAVSALLRCTYSPTAFRERLTGFWADHFTAYGKANILRTANAPYVQSAIRPHVAGRFGDMLVAVVTHPVMLHYLDQNSSVGPGSKVAGKRKKLEGLNENLAREVMELHTLGVDGPYSQTDVRQLAELFTGLTYSIDEGFVFRRNYAEPGAETVLGHSYGGDPARLEPIVAALHDLAIHPATAHHIARKLAVHFIADTPPADLVDQLTQRFIETGGDLMAVYAALLEHPAAWDTTARNVKPPVDFIASAWRALAVDENHAKALKIRDIRRTLIRPLNEMGQPWLRPNGPDGWPEQDDAWITPQGVATRLRWAISMPQLLRPDLPDPRVFVTQALGSRAPEPVLFAAKAAESQNEAIGLILSSPAFQRR